MASGLLDRTSLNKTEFYHIHSCWGDGLRSEQTSMGHWNKLSAPQRTTLEWKEHVEEPNIKNLSRKYWSNYYASFSRLFSLCYTLRVVSGVPCVFTVHGTSAQPSVPGGSLPVSLTLSPALRKQLHKGWKRIASAWKGGGSCWKARQREMIHSWVPKLPETLTSISSYLI